MHLAPRRLFQVLFDENVEVVIVCGIGYDCAVGRTARDAAAYGMLARWLTKSSNP